MTECFYEKPEHGWTCFHCGETFNAVGAARDHFGFDPSSDPACRIKAGAERGLVMRLREAEQAVVEAEERLLVESGDAIRAMRAMVSRHAQQLREVEDLEYERGLRDGRALTDGEK